jgi:predicted dehydrogenase
MFHMMEMVSGIQPESLSADLTSFVPGRRLDDTGLVRLRYPGGARGVLTVTQAAAASGGEVQFQIMGDKGGISWRLDRTEELTLLTLGAPADTITVETPGPLPDIPGAPKGFLNAFAGIYAQMAGAIRGEILHYPDIGHGVRGMRFIEAAVRSGQADGAWAPL